MEKIIAQRELKGRKPNGDTVRAVAKLYQLGGNPRPHFSVTTDSGCDHESILAAFPELADLVKLHLADDTGTPMHAVANALYHAENGDADALSRHLGIAHQKAVELIGRVHAEGPAVRPAAEKAAREQRAALESRIKRLRGMIEPTHKDYSPRGMRALRDLDKAEKELAALPPVDSVVAGVVRAARYEVVKSFVDDTLRAGWQAEADKWRAWLSEAPTYETGTQDTDTTAPAIQLPGGETFNVRVDADGMEYPEVTDGDRRYIIFPDRETAGKAARRHWASMADDDPEEFACLIGAETLARWGMGKAAGPGSTQVKSLTAWLDLWLDNPAEELARYDGAEVDAFANPALCEELGIEIDPDDDLEAEPNEGDRPETWRPVKLYRDC